MSWYTNGAPGTPEERVGVLPAPLYWWQGGATWGGLIDYWAYTGDDRYNGDVQRALRAQSSNTNDFMKMEYHLSLGNDDQAFWALATLNALEYGFPVPEGESSGLLVRAQRQHISHTDPRWDTETCDGGLRWQIFDYNRGWDYKNSVSNAAMFQMAARLARYTGGDSDYVEWAERSYQWMEDVGLISEAFQVFDGTDANIDCSELNHIEWSYNAALTLYGVANMYSLTGGAQPWSDRLDGLFRHIQQSFFSLRKTSPASTCMCLCSQSDPYTY